MDRYASFEELAQCEVEGIDYIISARDGVSSIAVIAPHGGNIEPGTADIADSLAADQHAFVAFRGIKKTGNKALHIPSDRFDEPTAVRIAESSDMVVTIHGCHGSNETVYVGGRNHPVKTRLIQALHRAGFHVEESLTPGLEGKSLRNICNRCRGGEGIQIEISRGLREKMFDGLGKGSSRKKTGILDLFVSVVKGAIDGDSDPAGDRYAAPVCDPANLRPEPVNDIDSHLRNSVKGN